MSSSLKLAVYAATSSLENAMMKYSLDMAQGLQPGIFTQLFKPAAFAARGNQHVRLYSLSGVAGQNAAHPQRFIIRVGSHTKQP